MGERGERGREGESARERAGIAWATCTGPPRPYQPGCTGQGFRFCVYMYIRLLRAKLNPPESRLLLSRGHKDFSTEKSVSA